MIPPFVLGDFGTGTAPSVDIPAYGPSAGGTLYTDASTIRAVQQKLGIKVDGVFGPQTEEALFKATGKHGPPDDETLAKLGIAPGEVMKSLASVPSPSVSFASLAPLNAPSPIAGVPWWQVALGAVGGVTLGVIAIRLRKHRRR